MNDSGWIHLTDALSDEECQRILAKCDRLFGDVEGRHPRDKPCSGTRHLEALDQRIPMVAEWLERSVLGEVVTAAMGRPSTAPVQVSLRSPQPGYGGQDLHRDTVDDFQGERATVVTAIVALVEFTAVNGSTRLVPGSHLTGESADRYRGRRSAADEIMLTGPAGTAFVFSGHVLHSGTENRSDRARPALQILWR